MGIIITPPGPLTGGELILKYDRETHKRGAGRKRKQTPRSGKLGAMNKSELDEWITRTDVMAAAEKLGVPRSTACRRKVEARQQMEYAMARVEE